MSIGLVKKNSSSPFQLQRSIVDQGGSGGPYESGGFNPKALYNNDAANAAVESFGKTIGAALIARGDKKKEDVKPVIETKKENTGKSISLPNNQKLNIEDQIKSNYSDYSMEAMAPEKMRKKDKKEDLKKLFSTLKF